MIYTVTLNPSIDYIVHVEDFQLGELNRMTRSLKLPGGKGINVSRILRRIGVDSTALGFLGGFTGDFIADWLKTEGISTCFTKVAEDTRINVKLKSSIETEINGEGPQITEENIQNLKATLKRITSQDLVILSGSIPSSLKEGFYQELVAIIKEKQANFIIDTTGKDLLEALPHQPFLIKPNNDELAELYHTSFSSVEEILPYGKKLLAAGAQNVLVSMGGDGALFFSKNGIYLAEPLQGTVKNSVGAGDSMIAGFIGSYTKTKDLLEAFRLGVACGSATAFSDDLASGAAIQTILSKVNIKPL